MLGGGGLLRNLIVGVIGALLGGGITMLRGRIAPGLMLCVAAIFVPALIWSAFLWANMSR